jgi:hypothetical protein
VARVFPASSAEIFTLEGSRWSPGVDGPSASHKSEPRTNI